MSSEFYFFDQYSRTSRIGGIERAKRDSVDFNQALHDVKVALSVEDDHSDQTEALKLFQIKKQTNKQTDDASFQTISRQSPKPILPEILTKELDTILQTFDEKSKSTSPSTSRSPSPNEEIDYEEKVINPSPNLPKVSLPSSLIIELHATWSDLIKNANQKYKVWRTKAGQEAWRQHIQRKRSQQLNLEKQQNMSAHKANARRRTSSRVSVSSITNLSHRQSITTNPRVRTSRSFSRASFLNTSHILQENLHLLKAMHQGTSENVLEPIKNGIHVEFKLSTQDNQTKQQIVLFDVPKPDVDFDEDIVVLTQNKCKRLLADTKQKILETTDGHDRKHPKVCRIWFYEDNQYIRNKKNFLTSNESNRRQKSKFVLSILRHQIPEKYNMDMDIPQTKHKCYIELVDGSTQIYYPSGRLAVLRLPPPFSTTLFFDDTDSSTNQFLGLVTSTGNVLLMQPTFHAHFITNTRHEHAYLCNGKTGFIEKEFQWHLPNNGPRSSISVDEDNINPPLFDNTVQLQINSFMQLEYHNSSNIRFAFLCQNEEFQYQLGIHLPTQSSPLMNSTTTILTTKINTGEKKIHFSPKRSNSISSNDSSTISEKKQRETRKFSDEQSHSQQLPMMQELILLRKHIQHICYSWLKQCRTTLGKTFLTQSIQKLLLLRDFGIMDIEAYCLSDLSLQPIVTQTKQKIDDTDLSKSAVQLNLRSAVNKKSVTSIDRQQLLTVKLESNVIANVIEQFIPHSDTGRAIKQRIYTKQILPVTLPVIK